MEEIKNLSEQKQKKVEFEALSPSRKVEAILAAVKEPVSRKLALDFAGIDLTTIDGRHAEEIDAVFARHQPIVAMQDGVEQDCYMTPLSDRPRIESKVDMVSVNRRLADVLWEEFFPGKEEE